MKTISEQLEFIRKTKEIGLMTHVVAGHPSLKETIVIVEAMEKAGVDFIEIQIPFSDPLVDGPTIMKANDLALENKVTLKDVFKLTAKLSKKVKIPLLLMGYFNSVFHHGVEKFCKRAKTVGVQGLIIPDIPLEEEEHEHFIKNCSKYDLVQIRVLSPTSNQERIRLNAQVARGFIYCTATTGTTGVREKLDGGTIKYLKKVRNYSKMPLAVGFGISKPEHIRALVDHAEIAVVGSAVIKEIEKRGSDGVYSFIKTLMG